MFKKFTPAESVSGHSQAKSSVQRNIRKSILEGLPALTPFMDELLPKKQPLFVAKCAGHISLVLNEAKEPMFYQIRDQHYLPTLHLLHRYPDILPTVTVDRGAIRFVLKGADIMCPGLTSKGGIVNSELAADTPVAILAEGKQHAIAIGITKMSGSDIKTVNKGTAIENVHYLNDGLWTIRTLE